MVDQALEYKSLLNKIHVMIDNVSKLGMDTKKYDDALKAIINEVESTTKLSKSKWGNKAGMLLICDYASGIKKLKLLEIELRDYSVYFQVLNSGEYLLMQLNKIDGLEEKDKVKSYADEIIKSLKSIKFSNTLHYSDEKRIVERIYEIAYKIIKLEVITYGMSQIYEYIKCDDTDIYFIDKCIRKEIDDLDLNAKKNIRIKEKIYEISRKGLEANYFDIELIKLLISNNCIVNFKENVIKELNSLKENINYSEKSSKFLLERKEKLIKKIAKIRNDIKYNKKVIIARILFPIIYLGITIGACFGIGKVGKNSCTKQAYPKTITTYSDEYGKEVQEEYSFVKDKEQDKNYIRVYGDWYDKLFIKNNRDIYTYDVSKTNLDNIEDYLYLNYEGLPFDKETITTEDTTELLQNGYVEVEQISINRDKIELILDKEEYFCFLAVFYTIIIGSTLITEVMDFDKNSDKYLGIYQCLYQLIKYNIVDYKKNKNYFKEMLKEYKETLNKLLNEINKYEELRVRFDELYNENKYLLDNPEKLFNKIDSLPKELSKEEIKGKLKSLKRSLKRY